MYVNNFLVPGTKYQTQLEAVYFGSQFQSTAISKAETGVTEG